MVKKRSCLSLGRMQQMACKTATTLFACTFHYNFVHAAQSGIDTLVSVLGAYSEESLYIPLYIISLPLPPPRLEDNPGKETRSFCQQCSPGLACTLASHCNTDWPLVRVKLSTPRLSKQRNQAVEGCIWDYWRLGPRS